LKVVNAYKRWIAHEKLDVETKRNLDKLRDWLQLEWKD